MVLIRWLSTKTKFVSSIGVLLYLIFLPVDSFTTFRQSLSLGILQIYQTWRFCFPSAVHSVVPCIHLVLYLDTGKLIDLIKIFIALEKL